MPCLQFSFDAQGEIIAAFKYLQIDERDNLFTVVDFHPVAGVNLVPTKLIVLG